MTQIFLKFLNMSIAASWLVAAVLLVRLFLKKAPKWISCVLWGIVAVRLMIPVSVPSFFSLIPSPEVIPQNIVTTQTPAIYSGIPQVNSAVNPVLTQQALQGSDNLENMLLILSVIWIAGMALMLAYSAVTYLKLRWRVRVSVCHEKNVYLCDHVDSPFILGILIPRIYIPSDLEEDQLSYVLAHENAHIRRRDHWWKPLGFFLLSIYWFNPLLWVAYILLTRDIEGACDEKVIAAMDGPGRKGYAETLVACSVHRKAILSCPLAFGEVSVKDRVKGIAAYKKPALWLMGVSVLACMLTAACFLTDPMPCNHTYQEKITTNPTCTARGMQTLTCSLCQHSYTAPVDMLAHTYDAGIVVQEPTCTAQGSKRFTCTDCGAETLQTMEKLPHTPGELTVTKAPNCAQTGEATAECTVCRAAVTQILETNDVHDFKQTVTQEATCNAEGAGLNTCSRCAHEEAYTIPKEKHTYKIISETVRCDEEGTITKQCTTCGHRAYQKTPAQGHVWTVEGRGNKRCTRCYAYRYATDPNYSLFGNEDNTKPKMPEDLFPVIRWDKP